MIEPALKQRLVGALVLVALAIIFVPMLVVERPDPETIVAPPAPPPELDIVAEPLDPVIPDPQEVLPSRPDADGDPEPITSDGADGPAAVAEADTRTSPSLPGAARPAPPSVDVDEAAALPALTAAEAEPAQDAGEGGRRVPPPAAWAVQVASFSSRDNARQLTARLREAGYHAFVDEVERDGRVLVRVRVGPEILKSAAADTAKAVAELTGLEPIVVRHR